VHLRITTFTIFGTLAAFAQVPEEFPAFEAASVRPTDPHRTGSTFNFAPGQLQIGGGTLRQIMEMAYDVRTFQILGGPAWLDADRYDISAVNDAALKDLGKEERNKGMQRRLQTLLADRFQVKVHRETREMTEYELVVARSGSKLKESDLGVGNGISTNCGVMQGTRTTLSNLAVALSRQLGRPVLDRTGLSERYDFELRFTPEDGCGSMPFDGASKSETFPDSPSIFAAIQEQMGLKLESIKGPVEVIAIDHAEKPEPN
jgi:bla regulator protein blaR1